MNTLCDGRFVKIWTDGCSPIMFIRILYSPSFEKELVELKKRYAESLREIRTLYSGVHCIFDFTEIPSEKMEALLAARTFHTPSGMSGLLKAVAVVMPENYSLIMGLEDCFGATRQTVFGVFKSFYGALHHVNNVRVNQKD